MPHRPTERAPSVEVLRLGHRPGRDPRLTTHLALTARAFGADRMLLNPPDPSLSERVASVSAGWGGAFEVVGCPDWRSAVRQFDGATVHLTMYGLPIDRQLPRLRGHRRILAIVGGAKVPPDLYRLATLNVAIGNQPHSEVAALAIFLDRVVGLPTARRWKGALRAVRPSARGKRVRGNGP